MNPRAECDLLASFWWPLRVFLFSYKYNNVLVFYLSCVLLFGVADWFWILKRLRTTALCSANGFEGSLSGNVFEWDLMHGKFEEEVCE